MARRALAALGLFCLAYPLFLYGWLHLQPVYGRWCGWAGGHAAALTLDWQVRTLTSQGRDRIEVVFSTYVPSGRGLGELTMGVVLPLSSFTFNAPLTLAILAALYPLLRYRWRALGEGLLFLVAVHLLYVYSACGLHLTGSAAKAGVAFNYPPAVRFFWEFLYAFVENMLVRFEPFLVAAFIWMRTDGGVLFKDGSGGRSPGGGS